MDWKPQPNEEVNEKMANQMNWKKNNGGMLNVTVADCTFYCIFYIFRFHST